MFYRIKNLSRKKLYFALVATIMVSSIGGGGLWKLYIQSKTTVAAAEAPLVSALTIGDEQTKQKYRYSGEVRGRYESKLAFQVGGKIVKRNVQLGSEVQPGDVLMQIDASDLQLGVKSTSAQVVAAESQLRLAQSNRNRYRQLYADHVISQAQLDQYENAYEVASATVQQLTAQQVQSENQLRYSALCADKAGIISEISGEVGQVVGTGQPVLTIVQNGEREVEISIPENRLDEIRNARQVSVTFWSLPQLVVNGRVREIAPMADAMTRTYKVRIQLADLPEQVKLGMTAEVSLDDAGVQNQSNILIPLSAIYQSNKVPHVWVVADHAVSLRPIQIGTFANDKVQVISGLQRGEMIVVAGVHKLKEGQAVTVMDGDAK